MCSFADIPYNSEESHYGAPAMPYPPGLPTMWFSQAHPYSLLFQHTWASLLPYMQPQWPAEHFASQANNNLNVVYIQHLFCAEQGQGGELRMSYYGLNYDPCVTDVWDVVKNTPCGTAYQRRSQG
jgi:hypothetical protein